MSPETHLVFVYGTLRRGASNAFRMEGAEFVRQAAVRGRLYKIDWYPGLVTNAGFNWVMGELWRVDDKKLRDLDEFEGVPEGLFEGDEYRRVEVLMHSIRQDRDVFESVEDLEMAWVWEWKGNPKREDLIKSGDWLDIEKPRPPMVLSVLGLVSLVAIPVGSFAILRFFGRMVSGGHAFFEAAIWPIAVFTPFVAFMLAKMGKKRREKGSGVRGATMVIVAIWVIMLIAFCVFSLY